MSLGETVLVGSSSTFPTEIYEHVIDSVLCVPMYWRQLVRTLLSCALVSRAWTPRSRLYLYTTIQFDQGGHGIDNSARKLARTLVAQPHLTRLVNEVSIVAPGFTNVPVAAALQNVPVLLAGKLPNLTTLYFSGVPPPTPQGIFFLSTPPEVLHRSFFASVATFPKLSRLELYCASFKSLKQVLQLLAGLRALRTLSMVGVDVIKWHTDPVHFPTRLPEVTNLAVGEPKDRWHSSEAIPKLSWTIVKLMAPTIEQLRVDIAHKGWKEILPTVEHETTHFPRLASMSLHIHAWGLHDIHEAIVRQVDAPNMRCFDYIATFPLPAFLHPSDDGYILPTYPTEAAFERLLRSLQHIFIYHRLTQKIPEYLRSRPPETYNLKGAFEQISTSVWKACTDIRRGLPRLDKGGALMVSFAVEPDPLMREIRLGIDPTMSMYADLEDRTKMIKLGFGAIDYGAQVAPGMFLIPCPEQGFRRIVADPT